MGILIAIAHTLPAFSLTTQESDPIKRQIAQIRESEKQLLEKENSKIYQTLGMIPKKSIERSLLATNQVSIPASAWGFDRIANDHILIAQVLAESNREIIRNPDAGISSDEKYLVTDTFVIGARLGGGHIADLSVAKKYSFQLIYSAATLEEAENQRKKFIVDINDPYKSLELPEKHVLIYSEYFDVRGRVSIAPDMFSVPAGPGLSLQENRYNLKRILISKKEEGTIKVYEDKTIGKDQSLDIFAQILLARIPLITVGSGSGKMNQEIYSLKTEELGDEDLNRTIAKVIRKDGLAATLDGFASKTKINTEFERRFSEINLILLSSKNEIRLDEIEAYKISSNGMLESVNYYFDGKAEKTQKWKNIFNKRKRETHIQTSHIFTEMNPATGQMIDPIVRLSYENQDHYVRTWEIESYYIPFINMSIGDPNFISFNRQGRGDDDNNGRIDFRVDVEINAKGISRILSADKKEMYTALQPIINMGPDLLIPNIEKQIKALEKDYEWYDRLYKQLKNKKQKTSDDRSDQNRYKDFRDSAKKVITKLSHRRTQLLNMRIYPHNWSSLDGVTEFQGRRVPLEDAKFGIRDLQSEIRKARKTADPKKRVWHILSGLHKAVNKDNGEQTYDPLVLNLLINLAGKENIYYKASVNTFVNEENTIPGLPITLNEFGTSQSDRIIEFFTGVRNSIQLWRLN